VGKERLEQANHEKEVLWTLAAMTENNAEEAEKLWMEFAEERAQPDAECTEDEVEQEATWGQEVMSSVLDTTAKNIKICARSKRWWNADINERTRMVGRVRRRRQN